MPRKPGKKRRRVRGFCPIEAGEFREARLLAGFCVDGAAAFLRVSVRTLRYWEAGRVRIPYSAFRLLRIRARASVAVDGWEGWHFGRDGALWSPEGRSFKPKDLMYLWLVFAQARLWRELRGLERTARPQRSEDGRIDPRPARLASCSASTTATNSHK